MGSNVYPTSLAASPGRCNVPAYSWSSSPMLGSVLDHSVEQQVTTAQLNRLLQAASASIKATRTPKYPVQVESLRYQTQDQGKLIDATGAVYYPTGMGGQTVPVILFLHGTSGFDDACAPSLQDGSLLNTTTVIYSVIASLGYVVIAPDYIGLKASGDPSTRVHPYLVPEPTAVASLDGLRAGRQLVAASSDAQLVPGDNVVMGLSQGAHAALFTVRYAPHYAPEANFKAAVYWSVPIDISGEIQSYVSAPALSLGSVLVGAILIGAQQWYGSGQLTSILKAPWDVNLLQFMLAKPCNLSSPFPATAVTADIYSQSLIAASAQPGLTGFDPWSCFATEEDLFSSTIPKLDDVPGLVVFAEKDNLLTIPLEQAAFTKLCGQGYRLQYLECAGAQHASPYAFDDMFTFIEARLRGDALAASGCQVQPATTCSSTP
jgi:acetyl esterase/lipase